MIFDMGESACNGAYMSPSPSTFFVGIERRSIHALDKHTNKISIPGADYAQKVGETNVAAAALIGCQLFGGF